MSLLSLSTMRLGRMQRVAVLAGLTASLCACGGGGGDDESPAPTSSTYIAFPGSGNGESVVDAYNNYAKFRAGTRGMEVAGVSSDITLDSSNNLVKGGSQNLGKVQLVAGSNGSAIAGMVAADGTMLAIEQKSGGGVTLGKSSVRFAAPGGSGGGGSGSGGSGGSGSGGSGGGSGDLAACGAIKYPGDSSDPQVYSYDYIAQFDACAYRATGDARYLEDGNRQCKVLDGLLRSTVGTFKPLFCNGPSMKY